MGEFVDNHASEAATLRRKLQSKAEALIILTQELDQCRSERDQLRLIAEQIQKRTYSTVVPKDQATNEKAKLSTYLTTHISNFDQIQVLKEQNKLLRYEVQDLKQKLKEASGDIKVLRANIADCSHSGVVSEVTPAHHREELVEQLEKMSMRVCQLESDLHSVLDEKEELVTEREAYRCKVQRLNHQIKTLLKVDSEKVIDIDALLMDNKYLQDQMQQLKIEKDMAQQALIKYKNMLEKRRSKGIVKLGNSNPTLVVTHKQVQELLERGTSAHLPNTEATLDDLRSLCLALLEALQDKSLALAHQKKANKILASRISELEHRLVANAPALSSQVLLQGFSSSQVDSDPDIVLDEQSKGNAEESNLFEKADCSKKCLIKPLFPMDDSSLGPEDSLPDDIQDLVAKALQEIHSEDSKKSC